MLRFINFSKVFLLFVIVLSFFECRKTQKEYINPKIKLEEDDRILVLAPHPDDEVLGCGGIIQKAVDKK
ncbi:MAG: PIG-L family deacetylase, partial [candidate division WOR-3 bacterium]